jgi:hypothetical protein
MTPIIPSSSLVLRVGGKAVAGIALQVFGDTFAAVIHIIQSHS